MAADGQKRTFAQKAGRFFRRSMLCAAFAAAAGGGYNFYGTQQDVTATVTSVEPSAKGDIIHTDKGDFVNSTSWVFSKNPDDVEGISAKAKPGAVVQLHVYGAHPRVLGHTPDEYGLYRNITDAAVITPPPAPKPVAPPVATAQPDASATVPQKPADALTVPQDLVNIEGVEKEDATLPEACALNSDFNAVSTKTPRLARDLDIMRQLPITGQQVFDMLKNPKNKIQSCLFPVPVGQGSMSTYDGKGHARIARHTGTTTTFHEYFHAMQSVTEGRNDMFSLTEKDGAVANLMTEASAVAYELAARQEAVNHGLKFYDPGSYSKTYRQNGETWTQSWKITAPADNPENIKAFKNAYDASFALNAVLEPQAREAAALEAGGKAVVKRLLSGEDPQWNKTNADLTIQNVNNNIRAFRGNDSKPNYEAHRALVFLNQSPIKNLNFIPDEFFGADANKAIDDAFSAQGFQLTPTKAPVPAPQTQAPRPGV